MFLSDHKTDCPVASRRYTLRLTDRLIDPHVCQFILSTMLSLNFTIARCFFKRSYPFLAITIFFPACTSMYVI